MHPNKKSPPTSKRAAIHESSRLRAPSQRTLWAIPPPVDGSPLQCTGFPTRSPCSPQCKVNILKSLFRGPLGEIGDVLELFYPVYCTLMDTSGHGKRLETQTAEASPGTALTVPPPLVEKAGARVRCQARRSALEVGLLPGEGWSDGQGRGVDSVRSPRAVSGSPGLPVVFYPAPLPLP